jgi:hypothetical protein
VCADLAARNVHEPAIMYWMVNGDVPSILGLMDESSPWFFMASKRDIDPSTTDAADLIGRVSGLADPNIEIAGTDLWVAHPLPFPIEL